MKERGVVSERALTKNCLAILKEPGLWLPISGRALHRMEVRGCFQTRRAASFILVLIQRRNNRSTSQSFNSLLICFYVCLLLSFHSAFILYMQHLSNRIIMPKTITKSNLPSLEVYSNKKLLFWLYSILKRKFTYQRNQWKGWRFDAQIHSVLNRRLIESYSRRIDETEREKAEEKMKTCYLCYFGNHNSIK